MDRQEILELVRTSFHWTWLVPYMVINSAVVYMCIGQHLPEWYYGALFTFLFSWYALLQAYDWTTADFEKRLNEALADKYMKESEE